MPMNGLKIDITFLEDATCERQARPLVAKEGEGRNRYQYRVSGGLG